MNEGTSTQAGDFSGRGNTGTLTGMANPATATSGWGNGKLGGGLNFDGSNDYVNLPGTLSDISGTVSTVSMWIKLNAYDTFGCIPFSITNIYWQISSNTAAYVQGSGVTITSTPFADGTWRYLTMTSQTNLTNVYVNGLLVGSYPASGASIPAGAKNAAIGDYVNSPSAQWTCNGQLDDVRIYNRVLSVAEIANLYQSGSAKINTSQNNKVTNGLVGLWSFDGADMSGNTAYNRGTASGANGTLTGGPTRAIGKVGQGMSFDGVNDYVDVPYANLDFERTDPFSFSVWAKWEDSVPAGGAHSLIGRYISTRGTLFTQCKNAIANYCNANSVGLALINASNNALTVSTATGSFSPNTWTHIVATYDGSSSGSGIKIYKDGVSMPVTTLYSTLSATIKSGNNWRIGDDYTNDWMKGNMDDVRIYNRALTQADVTQLYNMGGSKLNAPQNNIPGSTLQSGLVGLWSFNGPDMSGNTAYDRSTSGNNGTLTNGPVRAIGKVGQGMSFDGVNDYVSTPYTNINFERTDPLTLSVWVKPQGTQAVWGSFLGNPTAGGTEGIFFARSRTNTGVYNYNSALLALQGIAGVGSKLVVGTALNSVMVGEWYHVVATYDGSSVPGGVKIYINGVDMPLTTYLR